MSRPILIDLYCGQGGAGMGYHLAGFDVVGVDINPQPRYPFEFHQGDALDFLFRNWEQFDAYHGSPPCQRYAGVTKWRGDPDNHPDLVMPTRLFLHATGRPWVIENVPAAPVRADYLLCGSMFDLPIRRHRAFEVEGFTPQATRPCRHQPTDLPFMHKGERAYADAMGCEWMSSHGGREAIPPAYTEFIGLRMIAALERKAA